MSDGNQDDPIAGLDLADRILSGSPFSDTLDGHQGTDSLSGGSGSDSLLGRAGNDTLDGGDDGDTLRGGGGDDCLTGGNGDDLLWDGAGADWHFGGLGADILVGRVGADTLSGGDGFDKIYGGVDSDELSGGGGRDYLYGGADNDRISGGSGNDKLTGGDGADVFVIEPGSGRDVIRDFQPGTDTIDISALGLGLSFEHIRITGVGPHTWIAFGNGDGLTLYNTDPSTISESDFAGLQASTTADLRLINRHGAESLTGGEGSDYVRGGGSGDSLAGGAGDDTIWDNGGDDTMSGGDGGDMLRAGSGADSLDGGAGDDSLYGGIGADTLAGGAGGDFLFGGADSDTLDGGAGADILTGGAGGDTFVLSDGSDVIRDFAPGVDMIDVSGRNVSFADITLSAVGPHTAVALPDGSGVLLINTAPGDVSETDFTGLAGDGDPVADDNVILGTAGDDSLTGVAVDDVFGLAGNDTIDLRADFGSAFGGDGNDDVTIGLTPGSSQIAFAEAFGGAGDDTITVLDRDASAEGGDGNDLINVHDASFVDGGTGTDTLDYAGDGVAIYDASFQEFPENPAGGYVVDGQTGSARGIESLGGGIVAGIIGGNGTSGDDVIGDDDVVQGSNLGVSSIFAAAGNDTVYGFAGNDSLRGQFGDDLLFGGDGDDTLLGDAGNDTLDGGAGSNTLTGGDGADVFVIGLGDTGQTITDFTVGEDRIDFGGPSAVFGELTVADTADGATLSIDGHQIVLLNGVAAAGLSASILLDNAATELVGTGSGERIEGGTGTEHIYGGSGNDTLLDEEVLEDHTGHILAGDGNDHLEARYDGGALFGGEGSDRVRSDSFFPGMDDGDPTLLFGGNDNDTVQIADINDVGYGGAGDDILVSYTTGNFFGGEGTDTFVRWAGFQADNPLIVDHEAGIIVDDDGFAELGDVENVGGSHRTGVVSTGQFASVDAGDGDDVIGDINQSTLASAQTIHSGAGNDFVKGYDFDDELYGGAGGDSLFGGEDDDTLYGEAGLDSLIGGDGNDVLDGGAGGDTLAAGSGNDTMTGGDGRDEFDPLSGVGTDRNAGNDVITDFDAEFDRLDADLFLDLSDTRNGDALHFSYFEFSGSLLLEGVTISDLSGLASTSIPDGFDAGADGQLILARHGRSDRFQDTELEGSNGADLIIGGTGEDVLLGRAGNDTIFGGEGDDNVNGGGGDDLLYGGLVESGADADRLYGGAGNDTLIGDGSHKATLYGGAGDDVLRNGTDNGELFGGDGNDTLFAGANRTELTGGNGNDLFVFDQQFDGLPVIMRDFVQGEDLLDFSALNLGFDDLTNQDNTILLNGEVTVRFSGASITLTEDDFIF